MKEIPPRSVAVLMPQVSSPMALRADADSLGIYITMSFHYIIRETLTEKEVK